MRTFNIFFDFYLFFQLIPKTQFIFSQIKLSLHFFTKFEKMASKFPEHKELNLSQTNKDVLKKWEQDNTFEKSLSTRDENRPYVFYEGPPSANGMPGIHHVIARSIKDIFCR